MKKPRLCQPCDNRFKQGYGQIGGCMMTDWVCPKCLEDQTSGNTAHDKVCTKCAANYGLCPKCGEKA